MLSLSFHQQLWLWDALEALGNQAVPPTELDLIWVEPLQAWCAHHGLPFNSHRLAFAMAQVGSALFPTSSDLSTWEEWEEERALAREKARWPHAPSTASAHFIGLDRIAPTTAELHRWQAHTASAAVLRQLLRRPCGVLRRDRAVLDRLAA